MEDLMRAIARAGDLNFVAVEFAAHPTNDVPEWRATGYRTERRGSPTGKKWGAVSNDGLRSALIALAAAVGQS